MILLEDSGLRARYRAAAPEINARRGFSQEGTSGWSSAGWGGTLLTDTFQAPNENKKPVAFPSGPAGVITARAPSLRVRLPHELSYRKHASVRGWSTAERHARDRADKSDHQQ